MTYAYRWCTYSDSKAHTHTHHLHTHTNMYVCIIEIPVCCLQVSIACVWVCLYENMRCILLVGMYTSRCRDTEKGIKSGKAYGHTAQTINRLRGSSAWTHLHTPTHPYLFRCMRIIPEQLSSILMAVQSHRLPPNVVPSLCLSALHQHSLEKLVY